MSNVRSLTGASRMTGLDWKMRPGYHPQPDLQRTGEGSPNGELTERKIPQGGSAQPLKKEKKWKALCKAKGVSCRGFCLYASLADHIKCLNYWVQPVAFWLLNVRTFSHWYPLAYVKRRTAI